MVRVPFIVLPLLFSGFCLGEKLIQPIVTYISFSSSRILFPAYNVHGIKKLNASYADDTPLYPVQLHQVFPYFGKYVDKIYVSPNGFVQMTPNPECGPYYCDPCAKKYYGSIGGIVSDLGPWESVNASISVVQSDISTIVVFTNVPLLSDLKQKISFKIAMLNEGTVVISYDQTPSSLITKAACDWYSGLAAPEEFLTSSFVTSEQQSVAKNVWNRNMSGVYPSSRELTGTGNLFIACPISTTWCLSPSTISTTTIPKTINVTTLSMSCLDSNGTSYVNWGITISIAPLVYHPCEVFFLVSQGYPRGGSPAALKCNLDSAWEAELTDQTSASIQIHWKPINSSSYQILNQVNTLPVQFTSSPSQSCSTNSATSFGECNDCEVCEGMISSCSSPVCDASHSSQSTDSSFPPYDTPFDSLYIQPSCSIYETDTCLHAFDLITDSKDQCCDVDDIDCMGICGGKSQPGYRSDHALVCCEDEVDCLGVCGGKSYVDACGVCGGTDTGQKCPTYVNISTNSISSHQLLSSFSRANPMDSHLITIENYGNNSIFVSFSLIQNVKSYDPWVSLPLEEYNITAKSSQTFTISSNISRIYSKQSPSWEVKTILIQ
jgi:hypothetical protein